jgi:hypothetical protein
MMICHNVGNPFARRVERAYRIASLISKRFLRRAVRAIVSPTHEMPPVTSVGRTYARWLALV